MNPLCGWWRRELARQVARGEALPPGSRLAQHVAQCESCGAAWNGLRHLARDLSQALAAPSASPSFSEQMWARLTAAEAADGKRRTAAPASLPRSPLHRVPSALAVAILLAALSLALARWELGRPIAPPSQIAQGNDILPRKREKSENAKSGGSAKTRTEATTRTEMVQHGAGEPRLGRGADSGGGRTQGETQRGRGELFSSIPPHLRLSSIPPYLRVSVLNSASPGRPPAGTSHGDLGYLNADPIAGDHRWSLLPKDQWNALEARVRRNVQVKDDFVQIPFPRIAGTGDRPVVAAVEAYKREAAVIDARLVREVTVAFKATALSDLCDHLRADTGIQLSAGSSVADEKVTIFCEKLPLREVMRQLSRPFGYTWLRSKPEGGEYRYELVQDLSSQLLEEELRNRDHHAALLVLQEEIERYRPFLNLSPEEAQKRLETAPAAEKKLLEKLAGFGHGPIQMYFHLSPQDLSALRAGEQLTLSDEPKPGERRLPPRIARAVLESFREWRVARRDDGHLIFGPTDIVGHNGVPPTQSADARSAVTLRLQQSELGSLTLSGESICFGAGESGKFWNSRMGDAAYAVGRSPEAMKPDNARMNRRFSADPTLAVLVTVRAEPSCRIEPDENSAGNAASEPRVTSADVLEALHRATRRPIIADFYTRLFVPTEVSAQNLRLEDALNQLSDAMRLRWNKDEDWLQFRSASFYDDRIKEVPNRLLSRWSASRQQHGVLTLDDLVEIAKLTDAQLDSASMAEGARHWWGLREWDLADNPGARPHLRFLAGFTPEQRQEAMSLSGLAFTRMSLAQQQRFLALATLPDAEPLQSLTELDGAVLRVDYSLPGGFQWGDPAMVRIWPSWVVAVAPGPQGRRVLRPILRARTREAVLEAVRRLDPEIRGAAGQTSRETFSLTKGAETPAPLEAQVFPTKLGLTFVYMPGTSNARRVRISTGTTTNYQLTW